MLNMLKDTFGLDQPSATMNGTLLGFDYGSRKMGVAVGQTITQTARPLEPFKMQHGMPNWDQFTQLLRHWQPIALVVGIPVNEGFEDQQMVLAAKKFARRLQGRYRLPVFGVDEQLTSFVAREALIDYGGAKALQRNSVDSIAAQFILETWLREYSK